MKLLVRRDVIRGFFALIGAFWVVAAAPPERPLEVEPYFDGDAYDPRQFEWLKGSFDDATLEEKATFEIVDGWLDECWKAGRETAVAQFAERGVTVSDPNRLVIGTIDCSLISSRPKAGNYADYDTMVAVLQQTKPIFDALKTAAELASLLIANEGDDLAAQLEKRTVQEQILRNGFSWAWSDRPGFPEITEQQKPIFTALLSGETMRVDHANTQWLKSVVEKHGWPTVSTVGEEASRKAWLLVQHADQDPVFQFDVLQMMQPLMEDGEVSSRNYAYLYDRVMLKITGKQRYATQMWCHEGRMEPQTLEDAAAVAALREQVKLEPLDEYRKNFPETCG
ncbi:MAG: hypothetical protein H2048_03630 [Erythrobacter sp.]|nr:hypothetical protein [Erythrobacter sp.]